MPVLSFGEENMKKRMVFVALMSLLASAFLFVGCSNELTIPVLSTQIQGYNDEAVAKVFSVVNPHMDSLDNTYSQGSILGGLPENMTVSVDEVYATSLDVDVRLRGWVAGDGTVINGDLSVTFVTTVDGCDCDYIIDKGYLAYGRTSGEYEERITFGAVSNSFDDAIKEKINFYTLIDDGEMLILRRGQ